MFYLFNKLTHVKCLQSVIKRSLVPSVRLVTTNNAPGSSPGPMAAVKAFLSARPLASNCITYGLLYTGSEFLQQTIMLVGAEEGEDKGYDTGSLLR